MRDTKSSEKKGSGVPLIVSDESGGQFLQFQQNMMLVRIKEGGYTPRSGLHLIDYLEGIELQGNVLDIGTGETGPIAHYALARGAAKVVACDLDEEAIAHAKGSSVHSRSSIEWLLSDVYEEVNPQSFDFILSNPPQMPTPSNGTLHDSGGPDGRDVLLKIVRGAGEYLARPNGRLLVLCFNFLGIHERFGNGPTIAELAKGSGLTTKIVASYDRSIRKGGKTEESIEWINRVYPGYVFTENKGGDLSHQLHIIEMKHE